MTPRGGLDEAAVTKRALDVDGDVGAALERGLRAHASGEPEVLVGGALEDGVGQRGETVEAEREEFGMDLNEPPGATLVLPFDPALDLLRAKHANHALAFVNLAADGEAELELGEQLEGFHGQLGLLELVRVSAHQPCQASQVSDLASSFTAISLRSEREATLCTTTFEVVDSCGAKEGALEPKGFVEQALELALGVDLAKASALVDSKSQLVLREACAKELRAVVLGGRKGADLVGYQVARQVTLQTLEREREIGKQRGGDIRVHRCASRPVFLCDETRCS